MRERERVASRLAHHHNSFIWSHSTGQLFYRRDQGKQMLIQKITINLGISADSTYYTASCAIIETTTTRDRHTQREKEQKKMTKLLVLSFQWHLILAATKFVQSKLRHKINNAKQIRITRILNRFIRTIFGEDVLCKGFKIQISKRDDFPLERFQKFLVFVSFNIDSISLLRQNIELTQWKCSDFILCPMQNDATLL